MLPTGLCTDVAPADDAKAPENNDIEKEAADMTAGADKLLAGVHLLRQERGARMHFSSTSLINNKNNRQINMNLTLENNLMLFISISNY